MMLEMRKNSSNVIPHKNLNEFNEFAGQVFDKLREISADALSAANPIITNPKTGDAYTAITTLEHPFFIIRSIPVVIESIDGSFVASFPEANINMSGDTRNEAVENLRYLLVDIFLDLDSIPSDQLGPAVKNQIETMRRFMGKRADDR